MERPEFDRLLMANYALIKGKTQQLAAYYGVLHDWEDLLQDALFKMLRFADMFDPGIGELTPWAVRIIANTVKTYIGRIMAGPYMQEIGPLAEARSDIDPEEQLQAVFVVSNLNAETRLFIEGYNYPEITKMCGFRSSVTAKNRIDKCAANLRKLLGINMEQGRRTRMYAKTSG